MSSLLVSSQVTVVTGTPKNSFMRMITPLGSMVWKDKANQGRNMVTMWFKSIKHDFANTGPLKVILWAVPNYAGGIMWNGWILAQVELAPLFFSQSHDDKSFSIPLLNLPPEGWYSIIIRLESSNGVYREHHVFPHQRYFYANGNTKLS